MKHKYSLFLILLGIVFMSFLAWTIDFQQGHRIPSVTDMVARGRRVLVIRFPKSNTEQQEEILVSAPADETRPPYVERLLVSTGALKDQGYLTQLSLDQWATWDALRMDWCQHPFSDAPVQGPVFSIAVRCPQRVTIWGNERTFSLPVTILPEHVRTLLMTVNSPSCQDPLCGW